MTYNDPDIVEAINRIEERKAEIRSALRSDSIPLRINPRATLRGWADLFQRGFVRVNPAIPRF